MIIKDVKPEIEFAQIRNSLFGIPELTAKANMILLYFLSKPTDWELKIKDLHNHFKDGYNAIQDGLTELRINGYADIILHRVNGRITGSEYVIYENPQLKEKFHLDNPNLVFHKEREKKQPIKDTKFKKT